MSRRRRAGAYGAAGALVVAGGLCGTLLGGGIGPVLAIALVGLGLVLALSLVFLEIGLSEDRERAREDRERAREDRERPREDRERAGPAASPRPGRRLAPRRMAPDRMRGRRRRLR